MLPLCLALVRHICSAVSSFGLPSTRHGLTGESPAKGHKDDEGTRAPLQWGEVEKGGTIQPGEEKAHQLINWYNYFQGGFKEDKARIFSVVPSDKARGDGHKLQHRRLCLNIRKCTFLLWGWPSTGTGCPGRLWSLHSWTHSEATWTQSWALGWDDLQRSLPTSTTLWEQLITVGVTTLLAFISQAKPGELFT